MTLARWRVVNRADPEARAFADRHYSRRTVGAKQFVPPGRPLVLLWPWWGPATAVWVSLQQDYQDHAWAGAWVCTLFRNESPALSSDLIRSAVQATTDSWGPLPEAGFVTFVDPRATAARRSRRSPPGKCFLAAGWERVGTTKGGHGRSPLAVLRLAP